MEPYFKTTFKPLKFETNETTGQLECPVNFKPINENKVRLTAAFIFILSLAYFIYPHWIISLLLVIDFCLRSFRLGQYSFLGRAADKIINTFSISSKPIDSGVKEFAARIGFIIADLLFIVSVLNIHPVDYYLVSLLLVFSFLESVFNFCAGCHVYTFYKKFTTVSNKKATA
jgi:hypothetical protein